MEIRAPKSQSEWDDYYDLRYRILREPLGKERGSERNDGDKTGQHLALFVGDKIKAIARLDQAKPGISQVRFVAVDDTARGKGYGRIIMEESESISKTQGNHKMILHARDYAVDFYLRLDYKLIEKSHLLFGVLQHFLMEKKY
jgi:predicted GNAT family N-acyltransferase